MCREMGWLKRILFEFLLGLIVLITVSADIGCFVCSSRNHSFPNCEDPFQNNDTTLKLYMRPCMGNRKDRSGLFPADHCIKIEGKNRDTQENLMIRTCSLDSGTLTADTEIVRISHCGHFRYNDGYYQGCVQSCDSDGCNGATGLKSTKLAIFGTIFAGTIALFGAGLA